MEKIQKELIYREPSNPSKEININKVMESMRLDLQNILEKIKTSVDSHLYGIIIGIDGSGRIPALVLSKTLNLIYQSKKEQELETLFISGSRSLDLYDKTKKENGLKKFFQQEKFNLNKLNGKKILIVDDIVDSGNSLELIAKTLKELELPYEIAVSVLESREDNSNPEKDEKRLEDKLGSKIIYGEYGPVSEVYGTKQMSGVHKSPDFIFSKPINIPVSKPKNMNIPEVSRNFIPEEDSQNTEVLKYTRELVAKISKELFEKYQ